ncbi:SMODS domain-containing nucleotidyltransferase [Nocardia abscessus]|uniref:SMODS domain-containing nucleotidyltransferase n=1 Tax=Nocardia abscessus TaxID=120957 RepID=UPI00245605BE|nr:nucleotidyltransferase [Nocardia abscessus]
MSLTVAQGFDTFLRWLTPTDIERSKASSHRHAIEAKLDSKFGVFQMFESGSLGHGTGVSSHSDADFFVSLKSVKPLRSQSILSSVRETLQARFPSTPIRVSSPAVVLDFGGGYERVEIIPAYYKAAVDGVSKYDIPGVVDDWLESTPRMHLQYVNDCNKQPASGKAKSMARLVKAWKYYREVPISSFYLEMRAAQYIAAQSTIVWSIDLYHFLKDLQNSGIAAMNDPTGSTGWIQPCSTPSKLADARSKLDTAVSRACKAMRADLDEKPVPAFEQLNLLFNYEFPSR